MHHAPQPGNDDHQAALLPIRELPAVGMLIALALVLALDGCMHTDIWGSGILRGCCGALKGLLGAAAGGVIGGTLPRDAAPTDARGSADTQVAGSPWLVAVGQAIEGRGEMVYGFALSQMLP